MRIVSDVILLRLFCVKEKKSMDLQSVAFIVLAAGIGKRMKSDKAKVLHELLGKPMVHYVVETAKKFTGSSVYVIIGYQSENVRLSIEKCFDVHFVYQQKQLGTGHAVSCVLPYLNAKIKHVIILCGDTPLISQSTIKLLTDTHVITGNDLTVLAAEVDNPTGYGRIIFSTNQQIESIVEETDASDFQRNIKVINTGIYCAERLFLEESIGLLANNNAQQEMYLTDIVEIGFHNNKTISVVICDDPVEMMGVNTRDDLRIAERQMQLKLSKNLDFHISP